MDIDSQWIPTDVVYRYSRNAGPETEVVDGHLNFKHALRPRRANQTLLQLERVISVSKELKAPDRPRRPVALLRSSPWKAGSATTPWYDAYDLDVGTVKYFGDSRPGNAPNGHGALGNRAMVSLSTLFYSTSPDQRQSAPPIAIFRGEPTEVAGKGVLQKGFVRFVGVAILESHETVRQVDANDVPFENIAFNLRICPLDDSAGRVDWNWINDRRDEALLASTANLRAPYAWRYWIDTGELPADISAHTKQ